MRYISKKQHSNLTKGHVIQDDLVIVVRGSSTGNNSIINKEYEGSNLNSQLAYLRVKKDNLISAYLFYMFNSPGVQKEVNNAISGSAQPQLPNNQLLNIKISYPSLIEQQVIVSKLKTLSTETKQLETIYRQKLATLNELKQSILQKAFTGQLTPKSL